MWKLEKRRDDKSVGLIVFIGLLVAIGVGVAFVNLAQIRYGI